MNAINIPSARVIWTASLALAVLFSSSGSRAAQSADYAILETAPESGGQSFSAHYAVRASFEKIAGASKAILSNSEEIVSNHGFVGQLEGPLFATGDLAISISDIADGQLVGADVQFTITVRNTGPDRAENARVTLTLPSQLIFVRQTGAASTFSAAEGVGLAIGGLDPSQLVSIEITARATGKGVIVVKSLAVADIADTNPSNNFAETGTALLGETLWTGQALDGLWHTPGNWQGGLLPGELDFARILTPDADIRANSPVTVGGVEYQGFRWQGAGLIKPLHRAEFKRGFIYTRLEFPPGAVVTFGSAAGVRFVNRIDNHGRIIFRDAAPLQLAGAELVNHAGAIFDIQTDAPILNPTGEGLPEAVIRNAGVWRKSAGAATTRIGGAQSVPLKFNNAGVVIVESGTVDFASGGESSGEFQTGPGGAIEFGFGNYTFNGGTKFVGRNAHGTGGILTMNGQIHSEEFALNAGRLGGTFTLVGAMIWNSGELRNTDLTIDRESSFHLRGAAPKQFTSSRLENRNLVTLEGGNLVLRNSTIVNAATGIFDVRSDSHIFSPLGEGLGPSAIENFGEFRKSSGDGDTLVAGPNSVDVTFKNNGTVQVNAGTLNLGAGGSGNGAFTAGVNSSILFSKGIFAFEPGVAFTRARVTGGFMTLSGAAACAPLELVSGELTGDFTISGLLRWNGGWLGKSGGTTRIGSSGVIEIGGAELKVLAGGARLLNAGTVRWLESDVQLGGSVEILNEAGGAFHAASNAKLFIRTGDGASPGAFNNYGTFSKVEGNGATTIGGAGSVPVAFNNFGIVDLRSGTLALSSFNSSPTSTLKTSISGAADFGRVTATAGAAADGKLIAQVLNGFTPASGQTFQIIAASPRTGSFTEIITLPQTSLFGYGAQYQPNAVLLAAEQRAPSSLSSQRLPNGQFQLALTGVAGLRYVIEATVDFSRWVPVATNVLNNGVWEFTDTTDEPHRFYRARTE